MRLRGRCPPSDSDFRFLSGPDEFNKPHCKINLIVENGFKNFELSNSEGRTFRKNKDPIFDIKFFDGVEIRKDSPKNLKLAENGVNLKDVFSFVKTCNPSEYYLNFRHPIDVLTSFAVAIVQLTSEKNAEKRL